MGSQIPADLPLRRKTEINIAVDVFSPRSRHAAEQASHAGATAIGPTSPFIKSLSSSSVQKGITSLIELAGQLKVGKAKPEDVFASLGVQPDNERPFGELTQNLNKKLREALTAQQTSTETALAVEDALTRSVMDFIETSQPSLEAEKVTREQLAQALRSASARTMANVMLKHVITSLIARILDAAQSDPKKVQPLTLKIREDLAAKLAKRIDQMATRKGIRPSLIAENIPKWTREIEEIISKYRGS